MRIERCSALFILLASLAHAQEFRASISGVVTDPTGAAIVGAAVTAVNPDTGLRSAVRTSAVGAYVLPQLPPGRYELSAEAAGFRAYTRKGIVLAVGDKAVVQIQMEVGQMADSITVTAELTGIESNQSVLGQLMDNKKVSELPLNGRQVFMLLQLSAGVIFTQQQFGVTGFSGTRAVGRHRQHHHPRQPRQQQRLHARRRSPRRKRTVGLRAARRRS